MTSIIGHGHILRELAALSSAPEPPHALLFDGPESTGRRLLALHYAKLLNCLQRAHGGQPCGECRPCRLIEGGNHADVVVVSPGETLCRPRPGQTHEPHPDAAQVRICQVRGLIDLVSRYPLEARYRVVIIDPAEAMNLDSANMLLKTLEEPPSHTAIVLLTAAPQDLLETIISRCRRFEVRPVARHEIEQSLVARGFEPALAARSAEQARGRPGAAIAFAEHPDLLDDRARLLERCSAIAAANLQERFTYASQLAARWRSDPVAVRREFAVWDTFWEQVLHDAAAEARSGEARGAARALRAIETCRQDLASNVIATAAVELMLLTFPRLTLEEPDLEEAVHG